MVAGRSGKPVELLMRLQTDLKRVPQIGSICRWLYGYNEND